MKAIDFLSLDKTLYPMHNQVVFKQYNLNALVKYSMLLNSVIFACYPFIYATSPYCWCFIIMVQKMSHSIWSIDLTGSNCLSVKPSHLIASTHRLPLQHGFPPKSMLLILVLWLQTEKIYQKISRNWEGNLFDRILLRQRKWSCPRFICCQFINEEKEEHDNPCHL